MISKNVTVVCMVSLFMTGAVFGQIQGTLINTDNKSFPGLLKWKAREKAYVVTANNMDMEIPLASVSDIQVPKPKDLDNAEKQIAAGNSATAIPLLEKIAREYLMLKWDKPAIRLLVEASLKTNDAEKAIKHCQAIIAADPSSEYIGEIAPMYWQALLKANRAAKVEELVVKAIKSGDRVASAFALLMRGDLILATGDTPDNALKALRDGYLRVGLLYRSEKEALPEALYKAGKCFEKAGQSARAEQMRSELQRDFSTSPWAQK